MKSAADHPLAHFPITVDLDFYEAVAGAMGDPFAKSYLTGAALRDGKLLPRTQTAWHKLRGTDEVRRILADRGVELLKPPPFVSDDGEDRADRERRYRMGAGSG